MFGRKSFNYIFLTIIIFSSVSYSQYIPGEERGDSTYRLHSQLENNAVRTTIFNFGLTGRDDGSLPITEKTPYEWPKNSGEVYMAMTQLFIGGEVTDINNNIIHIIDVSNGRVSPQGKTWNYEPIPGYYNQASGEIANSKNHDSWPDLWPDRMNDPLDPGWPGSWDGYLGKNNFLHGQEYYYKISDDKYDRYAYFPDSTDLTRKGLGLLVNCRAIEMNDPLFKNIVLYSYIIKNDGTNPVNKMALSLWVADFVGGDGDSQDDITHYDLNNNLVYFSDSDGRAPTFGNDPVGMVGVAFLKTPLIINGSGQLGITGVKIAPSNSLNINNDESMWNDLMIPGNYSDTNHVAGDYDTFISSSYFSLQPGESTELFLAVIFGNGPDNQTKLTDLYSNLYLAKLLYESNFSFDNFTIDINYPQPGEIISGNTNIQWILNGASGNTASYVFLSGNYGNNWKYLGQFNNANNLNLNSLNFDDGILNKMMIIASDENGFGLTEMQNSFTINNSQQVPPQIYITSLAESDTIINGHQFEWVAGDADGDSYVVYLFYKNTQSADWIPVAENMIGINTFFWDTRALPNSNSYKILAEVLAGNDTGYFRINNITLNNNRIIYEDTLYNYIVNTLATGSFEIHIVNNAEVTGHTYKVLFDTLPGSQLVYDVIDQTYGGQILTNVTEVNGTIEGPYFDGIRLLITNTPFAVNPFYSGWNNPDVYGFTFMKFQLGNVEGSYRSEDYKIVMGPVGIDTSEEFTLNGHIYPSKPVNFKVLKISENIRINFGFMEADSSSGSGRFSFNGPYKDRIVFLEDDGAGSEEYTYWVYLNNDSGNRLPDTGDTLTVIQYKAFLPGDYFIFDTENIVNIEDKNQTQYSFRLSQNYPNPFNPETRISFQIPESGHVELKVYDILGREVCTLVNSYRNSGNYIVDFNASKLATGVYIYRLTTGKYSSSKKLLLLK